MLYIDEEKTILRSFKDKIILFVSLIVLIPLALRTTFVYERTRELLFESVFESSSNMVSHIVSDLESDIESIENDLIIMSDLSDMSRLTVDDESKDRISNVFISYLSQNVNVNEISFLDKNGDEYLVADISMGYPTVVDDSELRNQAYQPFFSSPYNSSSEEIFISSFNLENSFGGKKFQLSKVVYSGSQKIGVLKFEVSFNESISYILDHTLNTLDNTYVIDAYGNLIFSPDFNQIDFFGSMKKDAPDLWKNIQFSDDGTDYLYINDINYLVSYKKVVIDSIEGERKLFVVFIQEESEVFDKVNNLGFTLIISSLLTFIITFIITFVGVSFFIRPLLILKEAVKEYNFTNKEVFKSKSSTEIEELSLAFLELLDKLSNSSQEIERKVETQTKEIIEKSGNLEKQRTAMINLIEDIDQQRKLNLQQAIDLRKFKLAIDSVSELIVITDKDGKTIYVNPVVKNITGYSQKESIGTKAGSLWGKQMTKEWYEKFWDIISNKKEVFEGTITNKKKNGEIFISHITVNPLLDDLGNVQHYISTQRDITKETKIDRMKTDFISLASHQLRTPLSAIRWFLEILLNQDLGNLNFEQLEALKSVNESNKRMISLVNALLNISRIESGRIIVNPELLDPIAVTRKTILTLKSKFNEKSQQVSFKADRTITNIMLDPDLFTQILLNFLTNANKYAPDGGKVEIVLGKKDENLIIKVSDNGLGIPEKDKKNIFDRFFRATNVVKKVTDGTGLGLYLSKIIVDTLGGEIGFNSKEGKGSTFWFSVPLKGVQAKSGEVSLTVGE